RGVERAGEPVVAGAGGGDAGGPLGGVELHQQICRAALLERTGHLDVLQLEVAAHAAHLGQRLRIGAGRVEDRALEPLTRGLDVGDAQHVLQNGVRGSPSAGDMIATGMRGVEKAKPGRPRQSSRMRPPCPRPSSTRRSTATFAAYSGSPASCRSARVRCRSTPRMIAPPPRVHDPPPPELSAWVPQPTSALSPTRPGALSAVPPVDVAAAMVPLRSRATAPTVPPIVLRRARSAWRFRWRSVTSDGGSHSAILAPRAHARAPARPSRTWRPAPRTR